MFTYGWQPVRQKDFLRFFYPHCVLDVAEEFFNGTNDILIKVRIVLRIGTAWCSLQLEFTFPDSLFLT